MKDERKTKKQLVNELVEMRQRISELETSETKNPTARVSLLSMMIERLCISTRKSCVPRGIFGSQNLRREILRRNSLVTGLQRPRFPHSM